MGPEPLTPERILEAAEGVLRRFGPAKTTVVDVARELGVSHGSVYRHFPSKAALRDAVAERWLHRIADPLAEIAAGQGRASWRLREALVTLARLKRGLAGTDPELFATYVRLAGEARGVIGGHEEALATQLSRIIADGIDSGEFTVRDADRWGRTVLRAVARFSHPAHSGEWDDPHFDDNLDDLCTLLLRGLSTPEDG